MNMKVRKKVLVSLQLLWMKYILKYLSKKKSQKRTLKKWLLLMSEQSRRRKLYHHITKVNRLIARKLSKEAFVTIRSFSVKFHRLQEYPDFCDRGWDFRGNYKIWPCIIRFPYNLLLLVPKISRLRGRIPWTFSHGLCSHSLSWNWVFRYHTIFVVLAIFWIFDFHALYFRFVVRGSWNIPGRTFGNRIRHAPSTV